MRTPLNGVIGMLKLLEHSELNPDQGQRVRSAALSAESLLAVIDDVLDYSALESGQLQVNFERVDVRTVVGTAVSLMAGEAEGKGLQLIAAVDPEVPEAIHTDPKRLKQILVKLISNAVDFTAQGSITLKVGRQATSETPYGLRFSVRDSGAGIASGQEERIFSPFTQEDDSPARRHSGAGLSLAVCRQLVGHLGGEIGVDSRQGSGSTFWFTVDGSPRSDQPSPEERSEGTAADTRTAGNWSVLVVEDNPINRQVTVHQLSSLGVQVREAVNGLEALEALQQGDFDLILMDIQMPEMDGYEATRELRRREGSRRHTPVVALTAHALRSDRQRCLEAGMDAHLAKPVSIETLRNVLEHWVGRHRPDSQPAADEQSVEDPPLLVVSALERLQRLGSHNGRDLLGQMIEIFYREAPRRLKLLEAACDDGDLAQMEYLSHSLKGSCMNLGAQSLTERFRSIETLSRNQDLAEAQGKFEGSWQEYEAVKKELQAFQRGEAPQG